MLLWKASPECPGQKVLFYDDVYKLCTEFLCVNFWLCASISKVSLKIVYNGKGCFSPQDDSLSLGWTFQLWSQPEGAFTPCWHIFPYVERVTRSSMYVVPPESPPCVRIVSVKSVWNRFTLLFILYSKLTNTQRFIVTDDYTLMKTYLWILYSISANRSP